MNKQRLFILSIIIIAIIILAAITYRSDNSSFLEYEEKIEVIATIVPQAEFVEKVGGEKVSITVLIPPGASPHTYEPKPSQMEKIAKADMYFKVGSPIEFELVWMDKIIQTNPHMLIIDCSYRIQLIDMSTEHVENTFQGKDPHIWLSPQNAIIMVENIYEGFVTIDPDNKKYYVQNKDSYVTALENLDKDLHKLFSGLPTKKFMVYHPAWGYLAHDYGLEMIPVEKEGKAPTPEGIAHLIDQAKKHNIQVIFATPEFEIKTAETVANEIGGSVVLVSPFAKDYIENLNTIAKEIVKSLQ